MIPGVVLATNPSKLILEPIDQKLTRFAKKCLTRKRSQALRRRLDELEVTGGGSEDAEGLVNAVNRILVYGRRGD